LENDVTAPSVNPSLLRPIFVGRQGIRAGWSIGLFFILMALMTSAFFLPAKVMLEMIGLPLTDEQPLQVCVGELAAFLGLLGASMIMAFIEHKPYISYGLEGTRRCERLFYGVLSGVIALSVLVFALKLFGFLVFDRQSIFGWDAVLYAFAWSIGFFLVGLYEEYLLRGYLQATLTRGIGFWWSALVLSLAFGCTHIFNKGESPVGLCSAALLGIVFCISLWYLKQLWWAIGFHASWNWSQSYLWGTANSGKVVQGHLLSVHPQGNILLSGGATGPEGSLLVIPLLLFIALLMWIAWRKESIQQINKVGASISSLR
jgi:membrane protease YdiL (CAAX protease family)